MDIWATVSLEDSVLTCVLIIDNDILDQSVNSGISYFS